jgi:hypothetical protein
MEKQITLTKHNLCLQEFLLQKDPENKVEKTNFLRDKKKSKIQMALNSNSLEG